MSDLDRRLSEITRAVDGVADRARRRVAERLGGRAHPPQPHTEHGLGALSIASLHKLEQANAELRHSLVEDSLYNLRVLAQALPEKHEQPAYRAKLTRSLSTIDLVLQQLDSYFGFEIEPGVQIRHALPEVTHDVEGAVVDLKHLAATDVEALARPSDARRFADRALAAIDLLLRAVDLAGDSVRKLMHSPIALLEQIIETHQDAAAAKSISIVLADETGNQPRIIARPALLAGAFSELLRNALAYAFAADRPTGGPRELRITTAWSDRRRTYLVVTFADNGCGFADEVRDALGQRGVTTAGTGEGLAMVRRIIEAEHLGRVEFGRGKAGGAEVTVHLPHRITGDA